MRIDHGTASYAGDQLAHPHTHHITKCLYEEETSKKNEAAAGIRRDTYQAAQTAALEEDLQGIGLAADQRQYQTSKSGKNLFREIWDAMGDDESAGEHVLPFYGRDRASRGVRAMLSAIRQDLPAYIVNKWTAVREKIKVGSSSLRRHFGRNKGGFAMSLDIGQQAAQNGQNRWDKDEKQKGTRQKQEEIPSAYQADNHLMDSYSKNGEYCRINENLTYQKK